MTSAQSRLLSAFAIAILVTSKSIPYATAEDARRFLGDVEIRQEIVGQSLAGHYSNGKKWAEDYDAAGSLSYREPNISVTGYWTLTDGVFCTFYRQQLGGGCWRVLKVGTNCYEFYGASRGPEQKQTDTAWTARGWKTKEAPGCGAPQIS